MSHAFVLFGARCLMQASVALACIVAVSGATPASATTIEPGLRYSGPKTLDITVLDTSCRLAKGLSGVLKAETFVMGHDSKPGLILGLSRQRIAAKALAEELSSPIPVSDGVTLSLNGRLNAKAGTLSANYRGDGVVGFAVARRDRATGRAFAFIAVAQDNRALALLKPLVKAMANSVRFRRPAGVNKKWQRTLAGGVFKRFNTTSTTTSERTLTLCEDGTFLYRSSSSGMSVDGTGVGASFAGGSGTRGQWKVIGRGGAVSLQLSGEGSSADAVEAISVKHNSRGHLLFDGTRWLQDSRTRANCR